jgi:dihydrolipoamide dehydrogenase
MVVGELAEERDLVVLGSGPGGYVAAVHAAELGRRVTVVEAAGAAGLGGTCLHVGCIPSKALIEAGHVRQRAADARELGLAIEPPAFDAVRFQTFKAGVIERLRRQVASLFERHGVELVHGQGRLTAPGRVAVELASGTMAYFQATDVLVATGSSPLELPALPFDGATVLDSAGALALDRLPASVVVVGAGYVGVELGTAFAKLGARVALAEVAERILPGLDPAAGKLVARRLGKLGVTVRTGARAVGHADGTLALEGPDGVESLDAEVVVVAVGRRPNTFELGLERAGARLEEGFVAVAARIAAPHLAAIGDVGAGPALAHRASAEARVAVEALCGRPAAFEPYAIPAVVFSDPEVATVGLTLAQAQEHGPATATTLPLGGFGRALVMGEASGSATIVADEEGGRVLGVHLVGPHVSELAGEAALALEMGATVEDLASTIHPHPTLSELLPEAAHALLRSAAAEPARQ